MSQERSFAEATFAEFFESIPANVEVRLTDVTPKITKAGFSTGPMLPPPPAFSFEVPAIRLWCRSEECDGIRTFEPDRDENTLYVAGSDEKPRNRFIEFLCRNCLRSKKKYAVSYTYNSAHKAIIATKLGEHPPLSLEIPSRLRKLVGSDQEKFDKGLKSEAHGLGIGAFAYYRQVIESQKDRLIDEIIRVANIEKASPELIAELEAAKREYQFGKAIENIKQAIPEILLIHRNNPLTVLHKALSDGLHAGTDAECLQIAQDIRVILSEFSERLATASKNDQQLKKSLSNILNRKNKGEPG